MKNQKSLRQRLHDTVDKVCDKAHDTKVKVQVARHNRAKKVIEATAVYVGTETVPSTPVRKLTLRERLFGVVTEEQKS